MDSQLNLQNFDTKTAHESTIYYMKPLKFPTISNKNYFATCGGDQKIIIWDLNTLNKVANLKGHKDQVIFFAEIPNQGKLISTSEDRQIFLWNLNDFTLIKKINLKQEIHTLRIWRILPFKFYQEKNFLNFCLSSSEDKTLKIFDFNTEEVIYTEKLKQKITCIVQFNTMSNSKYDNISNKELKNSMLIVTGDSSSKIKIWKVSFVVLRHDAGIYNDGKSYNIKEIKLLNTYEFHTNYVSEIKKIKNLDSKLTIATASADETINLIDLDKGYLLMTFKGHVDRIYFLEPISLTCYWDENKENKFQMNCIVSGGKDKMLKIWNIETGKCFRTFNDHKEKIKCIINYNNFFKKCKNKNKNFEVNVSDFAKKVDFLTCDSSGVYKIWGNK